MLMHAEICIHNLAWPLLKVRASSLSEFLKVPPLLLRFNSNPRPQNNLLALDKCIPRSFGDNYNNKSTNPRSRFIHEVDVL